MSYPLFVLWGKTMHGLGKELGIQITVVRKVAVLKEVTTQWLHGTQCIT